MALVELKVFNQPEEAWVVASMLRANGVPVLMQNEHWGMVEFYMRNAIGGFRLWTPEEDADLARSLIDAPPLPEPEDDDPVDDPVGVRPGKRVAAIVPLLLLTLAGAIFA